MVRGDSAFGSKKVITTCVDQGVQFSLSAARNRAITTALESIDESAYIPVHYPGSVTDPDTGAVAMADRMENPVGQHHRL